MRRALLLLLVMVSTIVAACSAATFDVELPNEFVVVSPQPTGSDPYGTGIDGVRVITTDTSLNICHPLASSLGSSLTFGDTSGFVPGHSLMILQVAATTSSAGLFEIARMVFVDATTVRVEAALAHQYLSLAGVPRAQACTVPELTTLTLEATATLRSTKWNGTSGGVLAFLVSTSLVIADGARIDADRSGFGGGACNRNTEEDTDADDPVEGGAKGEGIAGDAGNGRRNLANGGGGGNPKLSGGGGGAAAGAGGAGGTSPSMSGTFGMGGSALISSGARLYFGGGGGGGHGVVGGNLDNCNGQNGGGLVFFQAARASGGGVIRSNGGTPGAAGGLTDTSAGGGGGAGGAVWAVVGTGHLFHPAITVNGGNGGNAAVSSIDLLPLSAAGGGGGGGWTKLEGFAPDSLSRSGGAAGLDGVTDAQPGGDGADL